MEPNDKKKKVEVFIESIGGPAPQEVIDFAKEIADVYSESIGPDDVLEGIDVNSLRSAFICKKKDVENTIKRITDFKDGIDVFLKQDPNESIKRSELLQFIKAIDLAAMAIKGEEEFLENISSSFKMLLGMSFSCDLPTYGEILDSNPCEPID